MYSCCILTRPPYSGGCFVFQRISLYSKRILTWTEYRVFCVFWSGIPYSTHATGDEGTRQTTSGIRAEYIRIQWWAPCAPGIHGIRRIRLKYIRIRTEYPNVRNTNGIHRNTRNTSKYVRIPYIFPISLSQGPAYIHIYSYI